MNEKRVMFEDGEYYMDIMGRYYPSSNRPVIHRDLDYRLPDPHYSDSQWDHEKTVWGQEEPGIHYTYSDRLYEWDTALYHRCQEKTTTDLGSNVHTPRWMQYFLCLYEGKTVELRHITACCNRANGFPVFCYGYRVVEKEEKQDATV